MRPSSASRPRIWRSIFSTVRRVAVGCTGVDTPRRRRDLPRMAQRPVEATPGPSVTWPELMAATSLAADIGMALPLETRLATCVVAVELGRSAGLDDELLHRVHQLALLQHIGCTAVAGEVAEVVGDELLMREHAGLLDFSDQGEMF